MDLSKEDLLLIEHALTREMWRSEPVADLLYRVRRSLLSDHDTRRQDYVPRKGFEVTVPTPKGKGWPKLKSS